MTLAELSLDIEKDELTWLKSGGKVLVGYRPSPPMLEVTMLCVTGQICLLVQAQAFAAGALAPDRQE